MKPFVSAALACVLLSTPILTIAQVAGGAGSPSTPGLTSVGGSDDSVWQTVQSLLKNQNLTAVADLRAAADKFRDFSALFPTSAKARDAKCLEAVMLSRAVIAGSQADDARWKSAVAKSVHDRSVTPAYRAELMATSDTADIVRRTALTTTQRMDAFEQSARGVMQEFPDLQNGYETLLYVARDNSDTKAPKLLAELAATTGAPEWVKSAARHEAARFALVGQSLNDLLKTADGTLAVSGSSGHPTVIYGWSVADPGSILRAKAVAAKAGAGIGFIGVCLDTDVAAARTAAEANALPGQQIFDALGRAGTAAQTLRLDRPTLIYGADQTGVIRSVTLSTDLGKAFLGQGA